MHVVGVILAGGRGERLWPLTRRDRPKPLLHLGGKSLLAQAVARLESAGIPAGRQLIVGEAAHEKALRAEAPGATFLFEPKSFNTAHSVALAAVHAQQIGGGDAVMVVVPSDHVIADARPLIGAIGSGIACAQAARRFVVFGVRPTGVSTAYGHLLAGAALPGTHAGVLGEYVEKPDQANAARMTASGTYLWNCGMFIFPVRELIAAFRGFQPEILSAAQDFHATPGATEAIYARGPHISIDHAIMEPAAAANLGAVVELDFKRIDAGNIASLAELFPADQQGNSTDGPALFVDSKNCFTRSGDRVVVTLGLENIFVAVEGDVVFVCARDKAQDVRRVLAALREQGKDDLL